MSSLFTVLCPEAREVRGELQCANGTPVACPAGFYPSWSSQGVLCIRQGAPTYQATNTGGPVLTPNICQGNPQISGLLNGLVTCLGTRPAAGATTQTSGTGATTTTQAATNPPFATLDTNYQSQVAAYEAAVNTSIQRNDPSRLTELRTMSEGIQTTLNKMIENLTYLKKETPDLKAERDKLLEDLRRIQQDYSAMLTNTDDLETLRRIRQQENGEARRMLIIYLMAFLFVSCMLLVYVIYTGRKTPTSATTAATPTMSPALT